MHCLRAPWACGRNPGRSTWTARSVSALGAMKGARRAHHMLWQCARFSHVREQLDSALSQCWEMLPS
eukprot:15465248-Alexandrium_andersonii.AAC.1